MDNLGRTVKMIGRHERQGIVLEYQYLPSPISVSVKLSKDGTGIVMAVVADPKVRITLNNSRDAWHGHGDGKP